MSLVTDTAFHLLERADISFYRSVSKHGEIITCRNTAIKLWVSICQDPSLPFVRAELQLDDDGSDDPIANWVCGYLDAFLEDYLTHIEPEKVNYSPTKNYTVDASLEPAELTEWRKKASVFQGISSRTPVSPRDKSFRSYMPYVGMESKLCC